jgi:hypothetical protein
MLLLVSGMAEAHTGSDVAHNSVTQLLHLFSGWDHWLLPLVVGGLVIRAANMAITALRQRDCSPARRKRN